MKKIAIVLLTVLLSACAYKHAPVYNPTDPMPPGAQQMSPDRVEALIIAAGTASEWKMEHVDAGHLVGTHATPKFSATVDVYFDQKNWRIVYKTSSNLLADPSKDTIHAHYNLWIRHLEHEISVRLSDAAANSK